MLEAGEWGGDVVPGGPSWAHEDTGTEMKVGEQGKAVLQPAAWESRSSLAWGPETSPTPASIYAWFPWPL